MNAHVATAVRRGAGVLALSLSTVMLLLGGTANAAIVSKVPMGTAAKYSVLASSTVTNTGNSLLNQSIGLSPGTAVTGFPPGHLLPPAVINKANGPADVAKDDLTTAYINAATRPVDFTTTSNLANKHLGAGVYSGPSKSPLSLTGPLVLDGAGDLDSVFIFQTNSTLITASSSTVTLVNGAQECNVFWQVGSSATLGTGSVFRGNILALTSITVNNGVTIHGRALARGGAVTLDNDRFSSITCAQTPAVGGGGGTTVTTTPTGGGTVAPGSPGTPGASGAPGTPTGSNGGPGTPRVEGPPRTGGAPMTSESFPWPAALLAGTIGAGVTGGFLNHRVRAHANPSRR